MDNLQIYQRFISQHAITKVINDNITIVKNTYYCNKDNKHYNSILILNSNNSLSEFIIDNNTCMLCDYEYINKGSLVKNVKWFLNY